MNQAGLVLVAVAGLWIAYLVPHRSRYRQELLESRADDRFSEHLRVLRVAHAAGGRGPGGTGSHRTTGVRLHPARRPGGGHMDRPHGTTDRVVADAARRVAAERAQRVAHLARRRAAARRRAVLTAVLLLAVVAGWGAVAGTSAPVLVGAVPSAALLGVLGLGRAAVRAGERADAAWAAGAPDRQAVPVVTAGARTVGRAVRPSDARTEVLARVPRQRDVATQTTATRTGAAGGRPASVPQQAAPGVDRVRPAAPATAPAPPAREVGAPAVPAQRSDPGAVVDPTGESDQHVATQGVERAARGTVPQRTSAWSPVPVPPPSYTLKPSAPRREPAPLPAAEHLAAPVARDAAPEVTEAADGPTGTTVTPPVGPAADAAKPLDLDAILARRRASGE